LDIECVVDGGVCGDETLGGLGVEAVLRRIDQQTEHQAGDGSDQCAAQPDDVL
jgi:hypothetical protein